MGLPKRSTILMTLSFLAFVGMAQIVMESYAEARAGGGRSGGFRGSRSYRAPSNPSQSSPAQPRREATPAQQPGPMMPQSGGFMRGIGTAILGGFLGSMLFSGNASSIKITRQCLPYYGGAAVFALVGQLCTFIALNGGQISVVAPLTNTTPLFVIAFTALFLRGEEKINRFVVIGVVLLVAGIAVITGR